MKDVNEAYKTLSDKGKRSDYDKYGNEGPYGDSRFGRGSYSRGFGQSESFFKDVFESFFGNDGFASSTEKSVKNEELPEDGEDILINLSVNFKESVLGTKKSFFLEVNKACSHCKQTGADSSSDIVKCPSCEGKGYVNAIQRTMLGMIRTQDTCSSCEGRGRKIRKKCSKCGGRKFIQKSEKIELNIPRGVNPERKLRYQGKGNDGLNGGQRGDIYVKLKIQDNKYFKRSANDIHVNLEISFLDAILGNIVEIITLEGVEKIKIDRGCQNDDQIVMNGKGCYIGMNSSSRGNLIAFLKIRLPKKLSPHSERVLTELNSDSS
jgi:molecular chaperone DnaJ